MYICAYACACVCTYLPNGRAYQIEIDAVSPSGLSDSCGLIMHTLC